VLYSQIDEAWSRANSCGLSQQIFFVRLQASRDMFRILKGQGLAVTDFTHNSPFSFNDTTGNRRGELDAAADG